MNFINSWSNVFKPGTIEEITSSSSILQEQIQRYNELMELKVDFNTTSTNYRLMRSFGNSNSTESASVSTQQEITSGLISFLNVNNFPDGIFLEIKPSGEVVFHIIELKRTPTNYFPTISKQFLSAYLHCKSLASILHLESIPTFKYYIAYNENVVLDLIETHFSNEIYNQNNSPRLLTGQPTSNSIIQWYREKKIHFRENNHNHLFSNIINIPLRLITEVHSENNPLRFHEEFQLSEEI